jgi:hypothetical protein
MDSDAIRKALAELNISFENAEQARERVLERLSLLHPDRTGGQFQSSEQQHAFQQLLDVRDALAKETSPGNQLVQINPTIPESLIIPETSTRTFAHAVAADVAITDRYRQQARRKYALPKITSAILASVCFALISLLGNLRNNPLYRSTINYLTTANRQALFELVNVDAADVFSQWNALRLELVEIPDLSGTPRIADSRELRRYWDSRSPIRVDLFSSDDPPMLKNLDLAISDVNNKLSAQLNKDSKILIQQVTNARNQRMRRRSYLYSTLSDPEGYKTFRDSEDDRPIEERLWNSIDKQVSEAKENRVNEETAKTFFATLQAEAFSISGSNKELESGFADRKITILQKGESIIFRDLVVLIVLSCILFAIMWARERSDERWVEYLSSDQGLQFVFRRICSEQRVMTRQPPRFTLAELTTEISRKEIQAIFRPILGRHLDIKYLSQLSALIVGRLIDKKVIKVIDSRTFESWFEIRVNSGQSQN